MAQVSFLVGLIAAVLIGVPAFAQSPRLLTEEAMVKTGEPGIEIYVRNKRPADMATFKPEQTVLYVHGATYPAETAFDLKLDDTSWMEYIASRGYDVWLLDVRGYGKSTRPPEMADKSDANAPIVTGETAVKDIGTVVDHILQHRNIQRTQFAWLVLGHHVDGNLHHSECIKSRAARPVCARLDSANSIAGARRAWQAWCLPNGDERTGKRAVVHRRSRRQKSVAGTSGLV